jgi:hypothetical protein
VQRIAGIAVPMPACRNPDGRRWSRFVSRSGHVWSQVHHIVSSTCSNSSSPFLDKESDQDLSLFDLLVGGRGLRYSENLKFFVNRNLHGFGLFLGIHGTIQSRLCCSSSYICSACIYSAAPDVTAVGYRSFLRFLI